MGKKISYTRGTTIKVGDMDFDKFTLFTEQEFSNGDLSSQIKELQEGVDKEFYRIEETLKQKAKVNLLKDKVRFSEIDGSFYPHVTSILAFAKGFKTFFPKGYAEAGTIMHAYCERWAKDGVLGDFDLKILAKDFPHLAYELSVVKEENIDMEGLRPAEVLTAFNVGADDFTDVELQVINREHKYVGRLDAKCTYLGKKSVVDWKSTSAAISGDQLSDYWQQLAAYSDKDTEQLVIVPFDRKLKSIRKPYILPKEKIQLYRELFLQKRKKFEQVFSI